MALIPCPECGRQISTEARACPQCGHPNRPAEPPSGPECHACGGLATTRCQRCGALSCALHLQPIYVQHGHSGAYELRCQSCYSVARAWKLVGWVVVAIVALVFLLMWTGAGMR